MELKHKHDLELVEAKKKDNQPESIDAEGMSFNTDDIIKRLSDKQLDPVQFDPDGIPLDNDRPDEIERLGMPKEKKNPFDT